VAGIRTCEKKRIAVLCALLCAALIAPLLAPARAGAAGAPKIFTLEQARSIAVALDAKIKRKNSDIMLKRIQYDQSVAGARAKAKNMATFRWTPLLSFKFPEKLDLVMDFELQVKPFLLQTEINTLQHEKDDLAHAARLSVSKLFAKAYISQESITFTQKRLAAAESDLKRNQARLLLGEAKQADVDRISKSVEALRSELALVTRSFENDKSELGDLLKLDLSTGYVFKNPLKKMNITRDQLAQLVDFTLKSDHVYYAARMAESAARVSLDNYERLFRKQYGGKVNAISGFLSQARNGQDIDNSAFKMAYDRMVANFDAPWVGKLKILFFSFPREWWKGQIDGIRYIEDEIYALHAAALDYLAARKDKESAEKDLRKQIASSYEALVTAKNSADSLLKAVAEAKTALGRVTELNKIGKAEFSEVKDKQDDYESLQADAVETLADYNDLLFDFERLTCGGVTKLLAGAGMELGAGGGGISRVDHPSYYIYSDVADMVFGFGIRIPDDYEPEIDAFEIWYAGLRIGARTPAGKELRHLTIDYGETNRLTVKLYNADEYVDECEIDTSVPSDVLDLRGGVPMAPRKQIVGQYSVSAKRQGIGSEIRVSVAAGSPIAFYSLSAGGAGLLSGEPLPVSQPFKYLSLLPADMTEVRVELFNEARSLLYTARFEPETLSLVVSQE
jgi:hypothetical protein